MDGTVTRRMGTIVMAIGLAIFLIMGSVAVLVAVLAGPPTTDETRAETVGTVVEVKDRRETRRRNGDTERVRVYSALVTYSVDGQTYEYRTIPSTRPLRRGQEMTISYAIANPDDAKIAGDSSWVPWFLGGMGLLFLLVFGGVGLRVRRSAGDLIIPTRPKPDVSSSNASSSTMSSSKVTTVTTTHRNSDGTVTRTTTTTASGAAPSDSGQAFPAYRPGGDPADNPDDGLR